MSEGAPSDIFIAYLSPIQLATPSETLALRWAGLEAFRETATVDDVANLVSIAFGKSEVGTVSANLVAALKNDTQFSPVGRDNEVRLLAAAAVDHLFTRSSRMDVPAALSVITASFGARKPISLVVDLIGRATTKRTASQLFRGIANSSRSLSTD